MSSRTGQLAVRRQAAAGDSQAVTGRSVAIRAFGCSDVGQVRAHNEDAFLIADLDLPASTPLATSYRDPGPVEPRLVVRLQRRLGPRGALLAVCDGMGGAAAGEVASGIAIEVVERVMRQGEPAVGYVELAARVISAIEVAGERIWSEGKAQRARAGMGTTATVAAVSSSHVVLGQIGDSRAYLLRGGRLVQITRDQSLVTQLIEAGQLTEEESLTFPHSNVILQALGTSNPVEVVVSKVELREGDTLLLCSDGLSGMLRLGSLRELLIAHDEPEEACRALIQRANDEGGDDNITVVIARLSGLPVPSPEEIAELAYEAYALPITERASPSDAEAPSNHERADLGADRAERSPTHAGHAPALEPSHPPSGPLPAEVAPSWVIAAMVGGGLACMLAGGYFAAFG